MTLDCSVSIPNVMATLWIQKMHTPLYQVKPDGKKVTQTAQNFTVGELTLNDAGLYKCIATSSVGRSIEKSIRFIPSSGMYRLSVFEIINLFHNVNKLNQLEKGNRKKGDRELGVP